MAEKVFVVSKMKNTVPRTYAIIDLNGEPITGSFLWKRIAKKKENTDHDHDKYITTSELNTLATNVVNTKISQANLAKKQILIMRYWVLMVKLLQIKQRMSPLKMNYKN